MSGGHGASRRRNYGKRQKDLRDRQSSEMSVDLEGPARWPRGSSWEAGQTTSSTRWGDAPGAGRQQPQSGSSH